MKTICVSTDEKVCKWVGREEGKRCTYHRFVHWHVTILCRQEAGVSIERMPGDHALLDDLWIVVRTTDNRGKRRGPVLRSCENEKPSL